MKFSEGAVAGEAPSEDAQAPDHRAISAFGVAVASGCSFFAIGMLALSRANPDEDTFILFRYVRHLVHGQGIVFNVGGVHAEGATDFLWMIALGGVTSLGVDVAASAVILNSIGAAVAAFVLMRSLESFDLTAFARKVCFVLVPLTVVSSSAATAAYGGFSSMLYAALILFGVHLSLGAGRREVGFIPWVAVLIGLYRPDGVLVGASLAMFGGYRAFRLSELRAYEKSSLAAAIAGAGYFVWRFRYFGLPLPLPLYVKSRAFDLSKVSDLPPPVRRILTALPGLGANLHWIFAGGAVAALLVLLLATGILIRQERVSAGSAVSWAASRAFGALPYVILWVGLCFAVQTQNIDWRFQSPIALGALYFAVRATSATVRREFLSPRVGGMLLGAAALVSMGTGVLHVVEKLDPGRGGYLNGFAAALGTVLPPGTRIAVTEAGRLPFWTDSIALDTVGLNSPVTALHPVSQKVLTEFDPQIVAFHQMETLEFAERDMSPLGRREPILAVDSPARWLRPLYESAFNADVATYAEVHLPATRLAALVMARYLDEHRSRYDLFAVDAEGDGTYSHFYGFRKDIGSDLALCLLRESLRPENRKSYFTLAMDAGDVDRAERRGTGARERTSRESPFLSAECRAPSR